MNPLFLHIPFGGPSAGEITQTIVHATRKIPCRGTNLFDREWCICAVFYLSRPTKNTATALRLIL